MRGVRATVATAFVVLAVALVGCSGGDGEAGPLVAEVSTTVDRVAAADLVTPNPPLPAAEIVRSLDAALAGGDFCALLLALDAAQPDPTDAAGTVEVYRALARVIDDATSFVPAEIRLDWAALAEGSATGADAVAAADGDLADAEVLAAFTSDVMVSANETLERYQYWVCRLGG